MEEIEFVVERPDEDRRPLEITGWEDVVFILEEIVEEAERRERHR